VDDEDEKLDQSNIQYGTNGNSTGTSGTGTSGNVSSDTGNKGDNNANSGNSSDSGAMLLAAGGVGAVAAAAVVYFMNRDVIKTANVTHNFFGNATPTVLVSGAISAESTQKIQAIANGQKLAYMTVNTTALDQSMELAVPVNTFLRSNFKVYRVVNGTASELKQLYEHPVTNAARVDGSYYISGNTVYIYSSVPAEYAIGYNGLF
jgi:hypothetical protein